MKRKMSAGLSIAITASMLLAACQPQGPGGPERESSEPIATSEISPGVIITQIAESGDEEQSEANVDVTPTISPEGLKGEPVSLELMEGADLVAEAKLFANSPLKTQEFIYDEKTGLVVNYTESVASNLRPEDEKLIQGAFNILAGDGSVEATFVVGSVEGEDFQAIKLIDPDTGKAEYVVQTPSKPVFVANSANTAVLFSYADVGDDGKKERHDSLAIEYDASGFTGRAYYGHADGTFSEIKGSSEFSAKNAMMSPQLESTLLEVKKELEKQGIFEYSLGVDQTFGGTIILDAEGNQLVQNESGEWERADSKAGAEVTVNSKGEIEIDGVPIGGTETPGIPDMIISTIETAIPGITVKGDRLLDPSGLEIPEFKIKVEQDGLTWSIVRNEYAFDYEGEKFVMPESVISTDEIEVLDDGSVLIQGTWLEKLGMFERAHATLNGVEFDEYKYSTTEVVVMLMKDTADANGNLNNSESASRVRTTLGYDNKTPTVVVKGRRFTALTEGWGDSRIYVYGNDGKFIRLEDTLFYAFTTHTMEPDQGSVVWYTERSAGNNVKREIFVGDSLSFNYSKTKMTKFKIHGQ